MRSAADIAVENPDEAFLRVFDLREIDSRPASFWTRLWHGRADRVLDTVARFVPPGGRIADVGCASGATTILLAERGFSVIGVDLRPSFLRYASKKEDRSSVAWLVANALELPFEPNALDALILGEILEHVAEPHHLVSRALSFVRPGGVLVCTTPNGGGFRDRVLPSYSEASRDLADLKSRQFGPAGEDHLFALRPNELRGLVPADASSELVFAGSGLWSRPLAFVARSRVLSALVEWCSSHGPWARRLCTTSILIVVRPA